jgi:hypothetical protein
LASQLKPSPTGDLARGLRSPYATGATETDDVMNGIDESSWPLFPIAGRWLFPRRDCQKPPRCRRVKRGALLIAVLGLPGAFGAGFAWAGPPYLTDDPEPVAIGHWDFYAAAQWSVDRGSANGTSHTSRSTAARYRSCSFT